MARLPFSKAPCVRVQTGIVASKNSLDNNKPAGEEGTRSARRCCFREIKVWLGVSFQVTHVYLGGINHIPSIQRGHKGCLCLPLRPGERHTCRGLNRPPLTVVIRSYSEIEHACARRCYNIGIVQRNVGSDSRGLGVSPCWQEPTHHFFRTGKSDHFL